MTRTCQTVGTVDGEGIQRRTAWTKLWRRRNASFPLLYLSPASLVPPWCVPLCDRGQGSAWLPCPVPALLPATPQEELQANSLLTPPSPAEPPHSLARDMQHLCPGLKVLRQATDRRILVVPAWRAHPQVTGYLSSPAIALTLWAGLDLRLPGASLPVAPGILGPPARHQAHCDAIQVLGGLCCLPLMFTSSRELFPHPPGRGMVGN